MLALPPRWALPFRRYITTNSWLHGKYGGDHPNVHFLRVLDQELAATAKRKEKAIDAKGLHTLKLHIAMLKRLATRVLKTDTELRTMEELRCIYPIGFATVNVVEPLLHQARAAQAARAGPSKSAQIAIKKDLMTIDRVGPTRARALIREGVKTVEEAKSVLIVKSRYPKSKLALEPVEQLETVTLHAARLVLDIIKMVHQGSEYDFHLVGRHRRDLDDGREILIIATHNGSFDRLLQTSSEEKQLTRPNSKRNFEATMRAQAIMQPLELHGHIRKHDANGSYSRVALFRIPPDAEEKRKDRMEALQNGMGTYVLVDLRIVPREALGAALLYHTGDALFVKKVREDAKANGMRLEEHGLWRRCSADEIDPTEQPLWSKKAKNSENSSPWRFIPTPTEMDAFEAIGTTFLEPSRRNLAQILTSKRRSSYKRTS